MTADEGPPRQATPNKIGGRYGGSWESLECDGGEDTPSRSASSKAVAALQDSASAAASAVPRLAAYAVGALGVVVLLHSAFIGFERLEEQPSKFQKHAAAAAQVTADANEAATAAAAAAAASTTYAVDLDETEQLDGEAATTMLVSFVETPLVRNGWLRLEAQRKKRAQQQSDEVGDTSTSGASSSGGASSTATAGDDDDDDDAAEDDVPWLALNTYGYTPLQASSLYPWTHLAEPHKTTELRIVGCVGDDDDSGMTYEWAITYSPAGAAAPQRLALDHSHGCVVEATLTAAAQVFDVVATARPAAGGGGTTYTAHVMCKYVRRELRDLTDSDREEYFSAMEVIAKVAEHEGKATYGNKFKNLAYFAQKHIHGPGCSPYHGGLSFVTAHAAFTLELDQALQLVAPSVATPYWDYTIDSNWKRSTSWSR